MSQLQLGNAAGMSQTTISDIERDRNLTSANVVALARALGVTAEWLAEGRGPKVLRSSVLAPLTGKAFGSIAHPEPSGSSAKQVLTPDEQALVDAYRLLEPADRDGFVMPLLEKAALIRRYMAKAQTKGSGPVASPTDPQGLQALIDRVCHPPDENDNNST